MRFEYDLELEGGSMYDSVRASEYPGHSFPFAFSVHHMFRLPLLIIDKASITIYACWQVSICLAGSWQKWSFPWTRKKATLL